MINAEDYLKKLNEKSAWVFTKQETDFDIAFLATKLFYEIPNIDETNVEQYFTDHHVEYEIETDRHRMLVIPQLFGLITKTPFYERGMQYSKEKTTLIFDKLNNRKNQTEKDNLYNIIKTEQLLKLKIHAIIDTANNNEDYHILPIIFIYKVLKQLQLKYGIKEITIDQLYTYIMTCKSYNELEQAVEYIRLNSPVSEYVNNYKSVSRVLTCIKKNINLFNINTNTISINEKYDEYFYNNFILKYDLDELNELLLRDVDYSYFLYNLQNFNINLVDDPVDAYVTNTNEIEIIPSEESEEENDTSYIEKVDEISENNVNEDVGIGAYKEAPATALKTEISKKYKRNPLLGKIAIQKAYYCCEKNSHHETFESARTRKNYMEAHHLVPVKYQHMIWEKYGINVDCVENIVSLCPTCHRAFHNGTSEVKTEMIKKIYENILPRYKSINFDISMDEILKLYGIK